MVVIDVDSAGAFATHLANGRSKGVLVVVDFYATWCGPCKAIAPTVDALSSKYSKEAVFLKVDVDRVPDVSKEAGVTAMPSFGFYGDGRLVELMRGADARGLEDRIQKYAAQFHKNPFKGPGYTLAGSGSGASAASASPSRPASSTAAAAGSGQPARRNPWADPNFFPGGAKLTGPMRASAATTPEPASTANARTPVLASSPLLSKTAKPTLAPAPATASAATPAGAGATPATTPAPATDAASSSASRVHDAALKVDESLLQQLLAMGFTPVRAEKSLILTQNKDVDVALEWLMAHQEDADIDQPLTIVGAQSTSATKSNEPNLDELDEDERLIYTEMMKKRTQESAASSSSSAAAVLAPKKVSTLEMTSEEKMQWLAQRRAEAKARKEQEALDKVKTDFKSSKGMTAALNDLKEHREEAERQAAMARKRKEEQDKVKQRREIAERLAADKERRRLEQQRALEAIKKQKEAQGK